MSETKTQQRVAKRPAQRGRTTAKTTTKRTTRRGAAYIRYSVERDGKLSDKTQLAAIKGTAAAKSIDIASDLVFIDRGKSAGEGKVRPELEHLLDAVRAGRVDYVLVAKLDRFTRSLRDFTELMSVLREHGVELIVVDNDFDTSSAFGKMMLSILAMFAEMERDMIVSRNRGTAAWRREQGMVNGQAPFGYRKVGKGATASFEIEDSEATLVRTIVDDVLGGKSLRQVAKTLDAAGITTRKGGNWSPVTVRQLLVRPTIAGLRNDPGDPDNFLVGTWEPIVDVETWHKLIDELSSVKRRTHAPGVSSQLGNLLSGVLFCGKCGAKMRPRLQNVSNPNQTRKRRYQCQSSHVHPDACNGPSLLADVVEQYVVAELFKRLDGRTLAPVTERDDVRASEIETELDELVRLYEQRRLSLDEYLRMRAAAQGELDRIDAEAQQDRRSSNLRVLLGESDVPSVWAQLPLDTQRAVIREVFESVHCAPNSRKGVGDPIADRITFGSDK